MKVDIGNIYHAIPEVNHAEYDIAAHSTTPKTQSRPPIRLKTVLQISFLSLIDQEPFYLSHPLSLVQGLSKIHRCRRPSLAAYFPTVILHVVNKIHFSQCAIFFRGACGVYGGSDTSGVKVVQGTDQGASSLHVSSLTPDSALEVRPVPSVVNREVH